MMTSEVEFEFRETEEVTRIQIRRAWGLWNYWITLFGWNVVHGNGSVTGSVVVMQHPSVRMPSTSVKMPWTVWWFRFNSLPIILSNIIKTSRQPSLWSHFLPFLTCKVFQNEVRLPYSHGHPKCFIPSNNLCPRNSTLSIRPFEYFVSFCWVFIKFEAKFDRATLFEISFLHFRNQSLLHTFKQLAVKSDVLTLSKWNLHWTSNRNVRLWRCRRRGYMFRQLSSHAFRRITF
jgi:hypothetical protein